MNKYKEVFFKKKYYSESKPGRMSSPSAQHCPARSMAGNVAGSCLTSPRILQSPRPILQAQRPGPSCTLWLGRRSRSPVSLHCPLLI